MPSFHGGYINGKIKLYEGVFQLIKQIKNLTEEDKRIFLEKTKQELVQTGMPWEFYETKILADIDATFDDEKFSKMNPEMAVDAEYARRHFGKQKPELADYLIWMADFVTGSGYIEI